MSKGVTHTEIELLRLLVIERAKHADITLLKNMLASTVLDQMERTEKTLKNYEKTMGTTTE